MPTQPFKTGYQPSIHNLGNKIGRVLWSIVWHLAYRPSPRFLHGWRRFLLKAFGAKLGRGAHPYPGARIWAPWNLELGSDSCIADDVDCYCVDKVRIGNNATVSQYSFLCTASHDFEDPVMPLTTAPITIGDGAWVCADVFVAPGVSIGEGAVVGARSSVFKDVAAWTVVAGSPAKFIKTRQLKGQTS